MSEVEAILILIVKDAVKNYKHFKREEYEKFEEDMKNSFKKYISYLRIFKNRIEPQRIPRHMKKDRMNSIDSLIKELQLYI